MIGTGPASTVGYYVHHVGSGHATRAGGLARAVRDRCGVEVSGLSTLPRPRGWDGPWQQLPPDEVPAPRDASAHGRLHWVPRGHPRTRARAAALSRWFDEVAPVALVSDVSVEASLLARLHGVPVVAVALPGDRRDDAHALGFGLADAVVGFWPPAATERMLATAPGVSHRVVAVGAHSSLAATPAPDRPSPAGASPAVPSSDGVRPRRNVVALSGRGGAAWTPEQLERLRRATADGWGWTVLGEGSWVEDPRAALTAADVVLTHAGQNAVADVAALRRPAVVVPADRPHDEQRRTGAALASGGWPVTVLDTLDAVPDHDVAALLERTAALPGSGWAAWCDGGAPVRFAEVVADVLGSG